MNFWRDKSLKALSSYVLVLLIALFIAEYFVVRYALQSLTEAERKIDFARGIQVQDQQIALQAELYVQGEGETAAELASLIEQQDHLLHTLGDGGRLDGTDRFITPLSRLPRITFDNLQKNRFSYKTAITTLIANGEGDERITPAIQPDSLAGNTVVASTGWEKNTAFTKAKLIFESQWLSLSRWYDKLIVDLEEEVLEKQSAVLSWFSFFILLDIGGLILILYFFNRKVLQPLKLLENNTANQVNSDGFANDEIGVVAHQINDTLEDLRDATDFVIAIGEGKLDLDYRSLDKHYESGQNKLADSLIEMQARLKEIHEEERKRQWSNEGLAKFVDILRGSNDDVHLLGDKTIAALVQYTNSNQGGLYILNDEDVRNKHLELISLFAFDIKKFEQQKIKLGEGILGQTFLEKETTYLTNLPESYIRITSGLGDANPKSILMVPLKVDTQVYGIIELASFNEYASHEIAFVEKLGESIASTLAGVRATQKNRQLIQQFQQQTEEMRAQEEEMRQNMEELQATQEEIARKEKGYLATIKALEDQSGTSLSPGELAAMKGQSEKKEGEYRLKIEELKLLLAQKPAHGEDWEVAAEVEKTLRINLEALQITQQELDRK